jgi:hypothetical protein
VNEVVPIFQAAGFDRPADYAANDSFAIGPNCIPLQRRAGEKWPTVEILFDKRSRPAFGVTFAALPKICRRYTADGNTVDIIRIKAAVVEGPAYFSLCKGHQGYNDCNFGYYCFSVSPQNKLRREVDLFISLLPWLFGVLDRGIPETWLSAHVPGYVDRHAFLISSWNIVDHRRVVGGAVM